MNSAMFRRVLCLFSFALVATADDAGAEFSLTPDELNRVEQGQIVVRTLATDAPSAGRVLAAVAIAAPVETVWAVMVDVERAPEFIPGLRRARALERGPTHDLIEHAVKYSALLPEFNYRYRADYRPPEQIDFRRVSGDLKALEGSWSLRPTADGRGTLVLYAVRLDPGFLVPQWLVRRSLQKNLPAVLLALRTRVLSLPPTPAPPIGKG